MNNPLGAGGGTKKNHASNSISVDHSMKETKNNTSLTRTVHNFTYNE
jgi:hypothetical protein